MVKSEKWGGSATLGLWLGFCAFTLLMMILRRVQFLPVSLEEAWSFFSNPGNLNAITPDGMVFKITSELPEVMYEGMLITYKISPVLNIPLDWVTEITKIKEGAYFIDEQRKGPYRIWHHEHHFTAKDGGVEMTDLLYYDIGKSIFGYVAGEIFVHRMVREIFDFRYKKLEELFGKKASGLGG
jgi:ligand-binding SRPBCC domain-containing protein